MQEVSLDLGKIELEEGESFVYQTSEKAASNEIDLSDGEDVYKRQVPGLGDAGDRIFGTK